MSETQGIVLTDPVPVPRDPRCPRCHAGDDQRVPSGGFGVTRELCRRCGYEFPEDTPRG